MIEFQVIQIFFDMIIGDIVSFSMDYKLHRGTIFVPLPRTTRMPTV